MTSAWFLGAAQGVPQDESVVRSTVEPVRTDPQSAEADNPPDFNEFESDESGQLTGLAPRVAGADVTDSSQYRPGWLGLASDQKNIIIDQQISTSGSAAKREEAGEVGHGTMFFEQSMEPVVRDGAFFGNDYFAVGDTDIQSGAGLYMTPPGDDRFLQAVLQSQANTDSRKAYQATQFNAFLNG
jgi:CubicO group peptidase (beta-lactamase class C family)